MPYGADMNEVRAMQAADQTKLKEDCPHVTVKPKDNQGTFDEVPNPHKFYVKFDLEHYLNAEPSTKQCWIVCTITKTKPKPIKPGGGTIVIGG